jgi:cell division protein FtsZ
MARAAAEADTQALSELCAGADLIVVVAGLGGGTGSGAAPVLARVAREQGALVLGLVVLPFEFEGQRRQHQAQLALRQLKTAADAVICLPNQKVSNLIDEKTTLIETFRIANDLLGQGLAGLWRLITREGLINVDFADLCRVVRGRQAESCFATAEAMGEARSREVMDRLLSSPLLDQGRLLAEADAVLVSLVGGADLTLKEVNLVMEQLNRVCEHAQVIMGAAIDATLVDRIGLTVVATKRTAPEPERGAGNAPMTADPPPPTAEFPTSDDDPSFGERRDGAANDRPAPRYVPPPLQLTPEQAEQILARQERPGGRRRRRSAGMRQELLPLEVVSKGRFAKSEPTVYRGEDLDTPSYVRKGMALN